MLEAVHNIRTQLKEHSIIPDVILAYPKGGLIIADLLSMEFDPMVPVCSIFTRRVTGGRDRLVEISNEFANLSSLRDKSILLVDDVVQSGSTLRKVYQLLVNSYNVPEMKIKVAVLGILKDSIPVHIPDFYAFKYTGRPLILPWGEVGLD